MMEIQIPGSKLIRVEHLVLNYSGTIAVGGNLIDGAVDRLRRLAAKVSIHILTTDKSGSVREDLGGEGFQVADIHPEYQAVEKREYIWLLGRENAIAIGNGLNDEKMFGEAALAIGILEGEGACVSTLLRTRVVFRSINEALDALLDPQRLVARLRV